MKFTSHHVTLQFRLFSLMAFSLFFTLSCTQNDEIHPKTEKETIQALETSKLNTASEFPITHTGCSCFMRVLSVTGVPVGGLWGLLDVTNLNGQGFEMSGFSEDTWLDGFNNSHLLPSDYEELDFPSAGTHTMSMYYSTVSTPATTNLTISTQVTCVSVDKRGLVSLGEGYFPVFEWNQGVLEQDGVEVLFNNEYYACEESDIL